MRVSRALLRQLVRRLLASDPDLEAFCLDHCQDVSERFTQGMDRLSKVNLLLAHLDPAGVFVRLQRHCGRDAVAQTLRHITPSSEIVQGPEVDALRDQLEHLYVLRAQRRLEERPTAELDQAIREIKQSQRQKPQLREGEVLGERYRLEEVLGRGGFAKVWLAFDREARTFVAVKVLHSEQAEDQSRVERFRRGALQLKPLRHPHLIRILDGPAEDGGFHYFVLEYAAGGDLHEAVVKPRSPLPRAALLRAILQAGEALEHAHGQGLVHRDVKPQNILLDRDGSARLTDFDLVLAADSTGGTRSGAMLGTYLFAAPEALEDGRSVDRRADVYSLGMTLLFVLHGRPIPPSALHDRRAFIGELACSQDLRQFVSTATAVDPADRPPTVARFCAALERALRPPAPVPRSLRARLLRVLERKTPPPAPPAEAPKMVFTRPIGMHWSSGPRLSVPARRLLWPAVLLWGASLVVGCFWLFAFLKTRNLSSPSPPRRDEVTQPVQAAPAFPPKPKTKAELLALFGLDLSFLDLAAEQRDHQCRTRRYLLPAPGRFDPDRLWPTVGWVRAPDAALVRSLALEATRQLGALGIEKSKGQVQILYVDGERGSSETACDEPALRRAAASLKQRNYQRAMEQSLLLTRTQRPTACLARAWQLLAEAACRQQDVALANEAYLHSPPAERGQLFRLCTDAGLLFDGQKFRLRGSGRLLPAP